MQDEDKNPDSIERLFQKKSEEYQIPFREEDWNRLEKRLELHDMQIAYRVKFRLAVAALILIISTVGYVTFDHNNRLNKLAEQIQDVTPQEPNPNESSNISPQDSPQSLSQFSENSTQDTDQVLESPPNRLEKLTLEDRPEFAMLQQDGDFRARDPHLSQLLTNLHHIPVSPASLPLDLPSEFIELRLMIPTSMFEQSDFFTSLDEEQSSGPFEGAHYTVYSENQTPNLSLGFAYSPDFSRSNFSSPGNRTGYRLGFKGEYQISKHLFLQAGLLVSKVHYTASSQQYNPPEYWNSGSVPDETNAICMILDIPIGLKYNLLNFNNSRFFSTAALSSYFMLNEEYSFKYSTEYVDRPENIKINNGSKHLLNHLNLSFGYEYDLTPNMTIRTEPFIHLPISGVGWGDVRFYSMGGFVSLNFQM
tara:strand:- start:10804 stop:12063 length:1260 start_codon:yes stop_codon:yes gene_type:complete